jgi:NAD-dependent SIR2 family protein deacetylase
MTNRHAVARKLRRLLERPDTIVFVGSGVSLWSGLPSWPTLLGRLADFIDEKGLNSAPVRDEIRNGDLLLAAGYAVHQLATRDLGNFLRDALHHTTAKPSKLHDLIADLGPSCFVTTNFDRLLETAIRNKAGNSTPLVVTNRQPAEIPEIILASARNFVFKYHGDLEDAESIVLSREQYRRVQHDFPNTIRAFSTLLATRPVVMIGFGLRDPDFLAVQDDLVATFQGQAGEYLAIMPDFDDLRIDYWRRNYRTDVITYRTTMKSDGGRDHEALISLLRDVRPRAPSGGQLEPQHGSPARFLLLARLGASVARQRPRVPQVVLPLTVMPVPDKEGYIRLFRSKLEDVLRLETSSLVIRGLPGS